MLVHGYSAKLYSTIESEAGVKLAKLYSTIESEAGVSAGTVPSCTVL